MGKILAISALLPVLISVSSAPAYAVDPVARAEAMANTDSGLAEAKPGAKAYDLFYIFDRNADNYITLEEQVKSAESYFDQLNLNRDGTLGLQELRARAQTVLEMKAKAKKESSASVDVATDEEAENKKKKAEAEQVQKRADRHLAAIDTDKDGKSTRDEYIERARTKHKNMDADGDGKVSRAEYDSFRKNPGQNSGQGAPNTNDKSSKINPASAPDQGR